MTTTTRPFAPAKFRKGQRVIATVLFYVPCVAIVTQVRRYRIGKKQVNAYSIKYVGRDSTYVERGRTKSTRRLDCKPADICLDSVCESEMSRL